MAAHARRSEGLVEVLEETACQESPIHLLSLPARRVLPKVRAFVDFVAAELARSGVETRGSPGGHGGRRPTELDQPMRVP